VLFSFAHGSISVAYARSRTCSVLNHGRARRNRRRSRAVIQRRLIVTLGYEPHRGLAKGGVVPNTLDTETPLDRVCRLILWPLENVTLGHELRSNLAKRQSVFLDIRHLNSATGELQTSYPSRSDG